METPKLGIGLHRSVPARDYHAMDLCSNSRLSTLAHRSPLHLRWEIDNPPEPTPALILGDAAHAAILEPDDFESRYVARPDVDRRTKEGKAVYAAFLAENAGKVDLSAAVWQTCLMIRDAVWNDPRAKSLLQHAVDRELTAIWRHDETGIECKTRLDALAPTLGTIIDVKTTIHAGPEEFPKSIFNFGYFRQSAFYLHAAAKCGLPADHFVFIAVETAPPFAVGVYRITDEVVEAGWKHLQPLIRRYAECLSSGKWCGYGGEIIEDIGIPEWALKRLET